MKKNYCIGFFIILFVCANFVFAQSKTNEKDPKAVKQNGIELYKKGEYRDAVNSLAAASKLKGTKDDSEVWGYLGLAYLGKNELQNARKAFAKAAKMDPQNAVYHSNLAFVYLLEKKIDKAQSEINTAIRINPQSANAYYIRGTASLWEGKYDNAERDAEKSISVDNKFAPAYTLKSEVLIYRFGQNWTDKSPSGEYLKWLDQAREVLEQCFKTCTKDENFKAAEEKMDSVKAFYTHFKKRVDKANAPAMAANEPTAANAAVSDPNNLPLKILAKKPARYTDNARKNNVQGTIRLAVVFSADATIKHILVLKGLGYGLDEEALNAARYISFQPATENGKPISVVRTIEYSFSTY